MKALRVGFGEVQQFFGLVLFFRASVRSETARKAAVRRASFHLQTGTTSMLDGDHREQVNGIPIRPLKRSKGPTSLSENRSYYRDSWALRCHARQCAQAFHPGPMSRHGTPG